MGIEFIGENARMSGFNLIEFLQMGGYATFVWSSFGIAFVVLLLNVILPRHRRKQLLREVRSYQRRQAS